MTVPASMKELPLVHLMLLGTCGGEVGGLSPAGNWELHAEPSIEGSSLWTLQIINLILKDPCHPRGEVPLLIQMLTPAGAYRHHLS